MTQPTGGLDFSSYTAIIESTLKSWGLDTLVPLVESLGKTGAGQDEITLRLQNSPEYKARFAGNDARIKAGLAPLDPATYLAAEAQYRQVLSDLPAGFYDSKADIDGLIGANVSPSELSDKVQMANNVYLNAAPEWRNAWDTYYGTTGAGGAVAAILDSNKADSLVQQQVMAAQIGGTALQQGLKLTSNANALKAAQQGVTLQGAQDAFKQIASQMGTYTAASARFGAAPYTQDTAEQATLLGNAGALHQQQLVGSEEAAQFGGHGATSTNANNAGSNL